MFETAVTFLFGIYSFVYLMIFFYPSLIHRRRKYEISQKIIRRTSPKVISHRGGKEFFNENSISSFKHSKSIGTFGVELDVFSTKDKQLIVLHDRSLLNSTGQNQNVDELNYDQIQKYHKQYNNQTLIDEKPPLFEDILKLLKSTDLMVNIDIKSDKDDDIIGVCDLIEKHGFESRVVIGCIMNQNCKIIIKSRNLDIPTFFNRKECILFFAGYLTGLLPFIPFQNDVLEIPFCLSDMKEDEIEQSFVGKIMFGVFNFFMPLLKFFNRHMNKRGIPVIFWTLNNEKDWENSILTATNGIMTDFPEKLSLFLEKKNLFEKTY